MTSEPKRTGASFSIGNDNQLTDSPNMQGDNIIKGNNNTIGERRASDDSDLKAEVQEILNELNKNPVTKKEAVATEAIKQEIKDNPNLKQRLINALKAGGTEALKQIFEHPAVSISIETIKGFLEGKSG